MVIFQGFTIFILDFMDTIQGLKTIIQGFKNIIQVFTISTQLDAD